MDERADHAVIRERLAELAAGVLTGDERETVLAHVAGCADCRADADALADLVDGLLALGPEVEPPDGFAAAVMARVEAGNGQPGHRRRPGRAFGLRVAAVLCAFLAGIAATVWATADDRRVADGYRRTLGVANGRYFTARRFTGPGQAPTDSRVFAYQGNPSWLFVVVRGAGPSGTYRVDLVTETGQQQFVGDVAVTGGDGSLGATISGDVADIAEIRLSGSAGPPLTADFR
jgi:hypothetical protein